MTQPTVEEDLASATDTKILAVLVWYFIKRSDKKIGVIASLASLPTCAVYNILNQTAGLSQEKYNRLAAVMPDLIGLATQPERMRRVVPTDEGIAKYRQLYLEGNAILFRDDPKYGEGSAVAASAPKWEPTAPPKAREEVRLVTKPIPIKVLSGLVWMTRDPKRRQRIEAVAEYLKENGVGLYELLQAMREDEG